MLGEDLCRPGFGKGVALLGQSGLATIAAIVGVLDRVRTGRVGRRWIQKLGVAQRPAQNPSASSSWLCQSKLWAACGRASFRT